MIKRRPKKSSFLAVRWILTFLYCLALSDFFITFGKTAAVVLDSAENTIISTDEKDFTQQTTTKKGPLLDCEVGVCTSEEHKQQQQQRKEEHKEKSKEQRKQEAEKEKEQHEEICDVAKEKKEQHSCHIESNFFDSKEKEQISTMSEEYNTIKRNENLPKPPESYDGMEMDMSKPIKVFILLGQSNMYGRGFVKGNEEGKLEFTVKEKKRFTHLFDEETKTWTTRKNVRNVFVTNGKNGAMKTNINDWLKVEGKFIGPEIQFGSIMGEFYRMNDGSPVLLIKSCIGNRSLGWDLLPPGSEQYEYGGKVYAGYKDTPSTWKKDDTERKKVNWYAGKQYDSDVKHAKNVLDNMQEHFPGHKTGEYEITGFLFWQGHKDSLNKGHADRYEHNLPNFIKSLRHDFSAPNAKFVCATVGFNGHKMKGGTLKVAEAQLAMNDYSKYPDHEGNVRTVDIRSSWRDGSDQGHHYHRHAEVFMEVGDALGWEMVDLLTTSK